MKNEIRMVGFPCACKSPVHAEVMVLGEGDWSETRAKCGKCGAKWLVMSRAREYGMEVKYERC